MATGRHRLLTNQLIRAARGLVGKNGLSPLPCFPLQQQHFGKLNKNDDVATPSDFHKYLCNKIRYAQNRIVLASLYIGVGSKSTYLSIDRSNCNSKEDELLDSLHHATTNNNNLNKVQVLLDANRALRKVSVTNKNTQSHGSSSGSSNHTQLTNSAKAVHSRIDTYVKKNSNPLQQQKNHNRNGLFLFHVNDKRLCTILPSPLDEVAGVFHIKCYIVDDELILSGGKCTLSCVRACSALSPH